MEARNNRVILAIGRSEIDVMPQWVHGASVYGCGRRWPSRRFGSGSGTLQEPPHKSLLYVSRLYLKPGF